MVTRATVPTTVKNLCWNRFCSESCRTRFGEIDPRFTAGHDGLITRVSRGVLAVTTGAVRTLRLAEVLHGAA